MLNLLIYDDEKPFLKKFRKQIIKTAVDIAANTNCNSGQKSVEFHSEDNRHLPGIAVAEITFKAVTDGLNEKTRGDSPGIIPCLPPCFLLS